MVEAATNTTGNNSLPSSAINHNHNSPPRGMSAETQSYLGLGTAMLLNSAQSCGYFGQKLFNMDRSDRHHQRPHSPPSLQHSRIHNSPGTLFTIDSILAPKPTMMHRNGDSPNSSPPNSANASPIRPSRLPGAMLHHPGIHLGHLAAAAASGFGNTSDFLGESFDSEVKMCVNYSLRRAGQVLVRSWTFSFCAN